MWTMPASVVIQVADVGCWMSGADLRWAISDVDIDAVLDGSH